MTLFCHTRILDEHATIFGVKRLALVSLFFLVGCCSHGPIVVRHQYLDPNYLASSHVETPDPRACDFYGQQLIISWHLPKKCMQLEGLHLLLTVRFGVHEVEEIVIPINRRRDFYLYRLMCQEHGGIVTYKVELKAQDRLLYQWQHQVWAELVEVK